MTDDSSRSAELVAQVAAAYFANSHVAVSDIPKVMQGIAEGLAASRPAGNGLDALGAAAGAVVPAAAPQAEIEAGHNGNGTAARRASAAQIRKSVRPESLISFEDGRPYKMLRLHLKTRGLSPDEYRRKWGLPDDYPMTAASHSATRAAIARRIGFGGRKPRSDRRH